MQTYAFLLLIKHRLCSLELVCVISTLLKRIFERSELGAFGPQFTI